MAVEVSPAVQAFVAEVFPAVVGVKRQNGSVHMTPVWFEFHDGYFWLNSWQGSKWMAQLQRDKTVTLMLLDPQNMHRYAEVQGDLVEATTTGADAHIDRLSLRYTGNPKYQNRQPGVQRVMLQIAPTRINSSLDRG